MLTPHLTTRRLFICARCYRQVLICSCCDRGQIYCCKECSKTSRRLAQKEAGERYQDSRRGRFNHAVRQRLYRKRTKKVTHQGSKALANGDQLKASESVSNISPRQAKSHEPRGRGLIDRSIPRCDFCGRLCSELIRTGAIRHRARGMRRKTQHPSGP